MSATASPAAAVSRALSALPDAATAAAYIVTWIAPLAWRADAVTFLMMVMLLEFLVVHSGGFIGITLLSDRLGRRGKSLAVIGFGAFYLLFAGAFSLAFHSWWPVASFSWLLATKFVQVWLTPLPRAEEAQRFTAFWALSVLAYLFAVFAGVILPMPALGITPEVIASLHLEGGGVWIERPQTVIASGTIYFALLAWSKWAYRPEWGRAIKAARGA